MPTIEERKLQFIGRQIDKVRNTVIDFFIEPASAPGPRQRSGVRHLIARYETGGGADLPIVNGRREFAAGIPNEWTVIQVLKKLEEDYGSLSTSTSETKQ